MCKWRVVTHHRPHLDEIGAILFAIRFGGPKIPGIEKLDLATDIIYLGNGGDVTPDGRPREKWEAEGHFFLGVCGGRFDEHARNGQAAKERECAATLMAKDLGIDSDPFVQPVLESILRHDTGRVNSFHMGVVLGEIYAVREESEGIRWAMMALDAKLAAREMDGDTFRARGAALTKRILRGNRSKYHPIWDSLTRQMCHTSRDPMELLVLLGEVYAVHGEATAAQWMKIALNAKLVAKQRFRAAKQSVPKSARAYDANGLRVVVVEGDDNDKVPAAVWALQRERNLPPCVLVHRQSDGHTQIYTQRGIQLDFGILAGLLRNAEIEAGADIPNGIDNLEQAGGPIVSWFYLNCENPMLLNGMPQHPGVPPSKLNLKTIVACIKEARLQTLAAAIEG